MNSSTQGDYEECQQKATLKESSVYICSPYSGVSGGARPSKQHGAQGSSEERAAQIELPIWLPERIRIIIQDFLKRSLRYEQLDSLAEYRGALEINRRHKWKDYTKAATAKKRQRRALDRIRRVSVLKSYVKYRAAQYKIEKKRASDAMKKLADVQHGVMILDEIMNEAFATELRKYAKQFARKGLDVNNFR